MGDLREAFDESVEANRLILPQDAALVEAGRKIASQIDHAVEYGEGQEVTKALYLMPHLVNILKEMCASPNSRIVVGLTEKESAGGKLAKLRSVQAGRTTA